MIILPNNGNVIMTAEQTVGLTEREVIVVPTRSIQAGLSAAVAFDKRKPGAVNAKEMRAAIDGVVTAEITRAVRDSLVDGVQVKAGDFIGLIDDRVVVAARELEPVVDDVVGRLLRRGPRSADGTYRRRGERGTRGRRAREVARRLPVGGDRPASRAGSPSIRCCCRLSRHGTLGIATKGARSR